MPELMFDEDFASAFESDMDDPKATTRLMHADFFNSMLSIVYYQRLFHWFTLFIFVSPFVQILWMTLTSMPTCFPPNNK